VVETIVFAASLLKRTFMTRDEKLNFLIHYLSPHVSIPIETDKKWRLFRALVNAREPIPVSKEFLKVQDELLQSVIHDNGITDISTLQPVRRNFYLWQGDITTLKVDAIVNAANNQLLGCFVPNHSCIDNAIHTFSGVQLRLACNEIMLKQGYDEPTGQAKITPAYNLPCKFVLHTVGPIVDGALTKKHCALLASSYHSCLELAAENSIESLAFCCISTGVFGFPQREAAKIATATVSDYIVKTQSTMKIVFNVFTAKDYEIYEQLLRHA
jgi:O-acetyl-ADP-ribose deacetylase (regulator of RNase III)